jgi:hypothetical protein
MKTELGRGVLVKTSIFRKKMIRALSSANSFNAFMSWYRTNATKSPLEIAVCIFTTEQVPGAFTTKVSKLWNTAIETDFFF